MEKARAVLAISFFLVLGGFLVLILGASLKVTEENPFDAEVAGITGEVELTVNYEIKGGGLDQQMKQRFVAGENAYESLVRLDESEADLNLVFDKFDFGYFLTSINGVKPSSQSEFWAFKINGQDSAVGVSDYVLQAGDTISFELTTVE